MSFLFFLQKDNIRQKNLLNIAIFYEELIKQGEMGYVDVDTGRSKSSY